MTTKSKLKVHPKLSCYNLPWETDWAEVFGTDRPLILEIGFGYGHYLEHLSEQHPNHNIIGLEINNFCIVKMENAIPRKGLDNVRVVFGRAETALNHLFAPETLDEVHINFPDPWFKARHSGRRLMQRDTLDVIVSRLKPDGKLYLATDIIEYAEMSHELLADTQGLTNTLERGWVNQIDGRIITKYERKAHEEGRSCNYFVYQRNNTPIQHSPVIKEIDMPHMVIKSPLNLDEISAQFGVSQHTSDETHIKFMNVYQNKGSALLFEAYVNEPTIDQQVGIVLIKREHNNEYTIKLSALGLPRPTDGLHRAVAILGDWLIDLHPENEVVQRKIRY